MQTQSFVDTDIIGYPELTNIYGRFAVLDTAGNGYLAVPVQQPDAAPGKGRRSPSMTNFNGMSRMNSIA